MKFKSTICALGLLGGLSVSSLASAATGDSFVSGSAVVVPNFAFGNADAQFNILCAATGSYGQQKLPSDSKQKIDLDGGGKIFAGVKVFGRSYRAIDLNGSSHASRQGNHLSGNTATKIVIREVTVYNRTAEFDQNTGFTNLEAPLSRAERVYGVDQNFEATFMVGPFPIIVGAGLSGSVSVRTDANASFTSDTSRRGSAFGSSGGVAQADVNATVATGIPALFKPGFYVGLNLFTLSYPVTGAANWDASSSYPLAERNHYSTVAALNLTGQSLGGEFGVFLSSIFGPTYTKRFAKWDSFTLFSTDIKRRSASDVGKEE